MFAQAAATAKPCALSSDCEAVGWPADRDGFPTCNCGAAFAASCGGDPVNSAAWHGDATTRALLEDWQEECVRPGPAVSGAPGICDCGPGGVGCVDDRCVSATHSCFVVDAGPLP